MDNITSTVSKEILFNVVNINTATKGTVVRAGMLLPYHNLANRTSRKEPKYYQGLESPFQLPAIRSEISKYI
jgi:hypothetical protein